MIKVNKEVAFNKAQKNANQMYEMISRNAEEGRDRTEILQRQGGGDSVTTGRQVLCDEIAEEPYHR